MTLEVGKSSFPLLVFLRRTRKESGPLRYAAMLWRLSDTTGQASLMGSTTETLPPKELEEWVEADAQCLRDVSEDCRVRNVRKGQFFRLYFDRSIARTLSQGVKQGCLPRPRPSDDGATGRAAILKQRQLPSVHEAVFEKVQVALSICDADGIESTESELGRSCHGPMIPLRRWRDAP